MLLHSASRETGCVMHRSIIALCFISLKIKSASSGKSHGPWGSHIYKMNTVHMMSTTKAASVKTSLEMRSWVYVNRKIRICIYKEVFNSILWRVSRIPQSSSWIIEMKRNFYDTWQKYKNIGKSNIHNLWRNSEENKMTFWTVHSNIYDSGLQ